MATGCSVAGPVSPRAATLTARPRAGLTVSATGSVTASEPGPMDTDGLPPNRSGRPVPATTLAPAAWTATAAPSVTGRSPNTFDSRTRTRLPAAVRWTIARSVWSRRPARPNGEVASSMGEAVQAPTNAEAAGAGAASPAAGGTAA